MKNSVKHCGAHLWVRLLLLFLGLSCSTIGAQSLALDKPLNLEQPVAFCAAPLGECTPDKYQALTGKVGLDIRSLNGNNNDPLTLVYAVPKELAGQTDLHLLATPQFRDHCFAQDAAPSPVVCSQRQLLILPLHASTRHILTQNVQSDDVRIFKPFIVIGIAKAVHPGSTVKYPNRPLNPMESTVFHAKNTIL